MLPPYNWELCPKVGKKIGNLFTPGKTFLDMRYDKHLNVNALYKPIPENTIYTSVVDLTNTYRYYNKKSIQCVYQKIKCKGHNECPSSRAVNAFINFCTSATSGNSIYVHCTFGYNRTGYMICCYLVERLHMNIHDAISEFALARPPGIYKQEYIHKLCVKYKAPICSITTELPEWLPDVESHTYETHVSEKHIKQNHIEIKLSAVDSYYAHEVNEHIAELIGYKYSSVFPGSQPVSINHLNQNVILTGDYRVTWKANGVRYLLFIDGYKRVFVINRNNVVLRLENVHFVYNGHFLIDTLVDCEYMNGSLFVFDAIAINGHNISEYCLDARGNAVTFFCKCAVAPTLNVTPKIFKPLGELRSLINKHKSDDNCDGFIFQSNTDSYMGGRQMNLIKWKNIQQNTVDFKLVKINENTANLLVSNGRVFSTINDNNVSTYDNTIVECLFNTSLRKWSIVKQRLDKNYPNSWFTAIRIYDSILHPIDFDLFVDIVEMNYNM